MSSSDYVVEFHIREDESILPKNQTLPEAECCFVKVRVDYFINVYHSKKICATPCDCFETVKICTNYNSIYIPVNPTTIDLCATVIGLFDLPKDEELRIAEKISSKIWESMGEKNEEQRIANEVFFEVGTLVEEKNEKQRIAHKVSSKIWTKDEEQRIADEVSSKTTTLRDDHRYRKTVPSFLVEIKFDKRIEYHPKESKIYTEKFKAYVMSINYKVPFSSVQIMKQFSKSESSSAEHCAVCLESLQDEKKGREQGELQLPCLHKYHFDCILDWFRESTRCPLCRAKIRVK